MTEGFEGLFPSGKWQVYGNPTWDDDDCKPHNGSWSAWCARSAGLDPCPFTDYPNNMAAAMIYGPFDLSDAKEAELSFWYWLRSAGGNDQFWWAASSDGVNFYGDFQDGASPGWVQQTFSLCDYLGDNSVWIEFWFESDAIGTDLGAFVDDIVLQKRTDGQPDLTSYTPPGWSDAIVASSMRGTHTSDPLEAGDTAFIDLGWQNSGLACAGSHRVRLFFNSALIYTSSPIKLAPDYYMDLEDIPLLLTSTGTDLLHLVIDADNSVAESNESNNTLDLFFDVGCWPGLAVGTGCSVVPGVNHPALEAYCTGSWFELADHSRIPGFNTLNTYWCIDSTLMRLFTDNDNVWDNATAHQCEASDAHAYTGLVYDYMRDVFGRDSYDGSGAGMVVAVGDPLPRLQNNSSWDTLNRRVLVGLPGSGRRSIAGCLDGVAHEWGHALTWRASNLVNSKESGALAESFSDMLGVSVGFAFSDPDFLIGENSYISVQAMRDMEHPRQYSQPDTYKGPYWQFVDGCIPSEANDRCWVHINSGVPNKMFSLTLP